MESGNAFYATGKRKDSVAKVWLTPGTGKIIVNNKDLNEYFELNANKIHLCDEDDVVGNRDTVVWRLDKTKFKDAVRPCISIRECLVTHVWSYITVPPYLQLRDPYIYRRTSGSDDTVSQPGGGA